MENKEIPLTDAAHQLGLPWERAWRALLTGRLEGQKRGSRWYVTASSVERLATDIAKDPTEPETKTA